VELGRILGSGFGSKETEEGLQGKNVNGELRIAVLLLGGACHPLLIFTGVPLRGAEHGWTLCTHCSQGQDVFSLNEGRNPSNFRK
jgi:hypothetical protein